MKAIANFNVRNLEWYWPEDPLKEAGDYYEEWKELNKDKVDKHNPTRAYKVAFDVRNVEINRHADVEMKYTIAGGDDSIHTVVLRYNMIMQMPSGISHFFGYTGRRMLSLLSMKEYKPSPS